MYDEWRTKIKRRPALKYQSGIDELSLRELGVTPTAQIFIFVVSLFPIVGIVIGTYYSSLDAYHIRSFGRVVLAFAMLLHFTYFCVICPLVLYTSIL